MGLGDAVVFHDDGYWWVILNTDPRYFIAEDVGCRVKRVGVPKEPGGAKLFSVVRLKAQRVGCPVCQQMHTKPSLRAFSDESFVVISHQGAKIVHGDHGAEGTFFFKNLAEHGPYPLFARNDPDLGFNAPTFCKARKQRKYLLEPVLLFVQSRNEPVGRRGSVEALFPLLERKQKSLLEQMLNAAIRTGARNTCFLCKLGDGAAAKFKRSEIHLRFVQREPQAFAKLCRKSFSHTGAAVTP